MKKNSKRILSIMLAFVMILTAFPMTAMAAEVWDGETADTIWYDENESDTEFTIDSAEELAGLAKLVNDGNNFIGKTIKLGADIDLGGNEWTPIGTNGKPFSGTFDGNNMTISNLYINKEFANNAANCCVGLFGYTSAPAVIKNTDFVNVDIQGSLYVGTVVGYGFTGSEISNCHVSGEIEIDGWWYIGGIGGNGYMKTISNCSVTGEEGSYIKGNNGSYVGGIWGYRGEGSQTISSCSVSNIAISGVDRTGGICGIAHYQNTIEKCSISNSTITTTDNVGNTGLIAGADLSNNENGVAKILDCTVDDTTAVSGGIAVTTKVGSCDHNGNKVTTVATVGTEVKFDGNGKIKEGKLEQVDSSQLADDVVAVPQEDGTFKVENMTTGNAPVVVSIGPITTAYRTLDEAIEAAKSGDSNKNVRVTIQKSGTYEPFTIDSNSHNGIVVEAAKGVDAVFEISAGNTMSLYDGYTTQTPGISFKNITFLSRRHYSAEISLFRYRGTYLQGREL